MTGVLRIERASGPVVVPFGPGDVQDAVRLRDRFAGLESVRSGQRRVEIVPAEGDAR
ncbi:hypothetical protein AB0I89_23410 [Micromonospora sp. NPDC049801]|uniref:hypothetical protein n=1 Tax=unclassified Micromonospora TaxID=2617518 RepID=UPI0033EF8229